MKTRVAVPALANAVCLLLLGSNWALAQSDPNVQLCQVALGERISLERGRADLALESADTYPISRGIEGERGKALLSQQVDLTTLSERVEFNCCVDTSAGRVIEATYMPEAKALAAIAKVPAILPSSTPAEHRDAVKACQEYVRNKIKTEHGDVTINFETVETNAHGAEIVGVKGRVRKSKGGDSATLHYLCRVEKATGVVKRAEYAKER